MERVVALETTVVSFDAAPLDRGTTFDPSTAASDWLPTATFVVGDRLYSVYRPPSPDHELSQAESRYWSAIERAHVGSVVIDGVRLLIVWSRPDQPPAEESPIESPARDGLDVLTQRELQIVALVAKGRPNKEIAVRLRISEWTVSTHLRRIFAKLGVESRAAMVFRCAELVRAPDPGPVDAKRPR
jgi:DNA-binding CsgD family transcriptional regulator